MKRIRSIVILSILQHIGKLASYCPPNLISPYGMSFFAGCGGHRYDCWSKSRIEAEGISKSFHATGLHQLSIVLIHVQFMFMFRITSSYKILQNFGSLVTTSRSPSDSPEILIPVERRVWFKDGGFRLLQRNIARVLVLITGVSNSTQ